MVPGLRRGGTGRVGLEGLPVIVWRGGDDRRVEHGRDAAVEEGVEINPRRVLPFALRA